MSLAPAHRAVSFSAPGPEYRSPEYRSKVVAVNELTAGERLAWQGLCDASEALDSPFFRVAFAGAVAASRPDVFVCVIARDGAPVAFFPFQYKNVRARWLRAGERLGGELSDHCGIVAAAGFTIDAPELLRRAGLSSFAFSHLDTTQAGFGLYGERPEAGPVARMDEGGVRYWQALCQRDKPFADAIRRSERKLAETLGPLTFRLRAADPVAELDRLMDMKRRQYARTGVGDPLAPAWTRALLHRLARHREPDFEGMLSTLYAGDRWLASHFGLRSRHTLHYWFPVYDPEHKRWSPGRLLVKRLLEAADEAGFRVLDYGAGDSWDKGKTANGACEVCRGVWSRPDLRSACTRLALSVGWRLDTLRKRKGG